MRPMRVIRCSLMGGILLFFYLTAAQNAMAHTHQGNDETSQGPRVSRTGDVQAKLILDPMVVMVGQPTKFFLSLRHGDKPLGPAMVAVQVAMVDDHLPVFKGDFWTRDGALSFALTFVDGSEHRVHLRVRLAEASPTPFSPFEAEFPVAVAPLSPPVSATARSLGLLLGVVITGLALGLWGGRRFFIKETGI